MAFFIRRLWNWCKRFRYRCGYGVHSPSDFFLITSVVYERLPYYAYAELENVSTKDVPSFYRCKVNRLLFRLVNYFRPTFLINVGKEDDLGFRYMKAARSSMKTVGLEGDNCKETLSALDKLMKGKDAVGMLLHVADTPFYSEVVARMLPYMGTDSCLIVGGIHDSKDKKVWWEQLKSDERVRVTFDLYDIGIALFDPKRHKQDYIVNFF